MYKLTLTAEGYNRIEFVFDDLLELTGFCFTAMHQAKGEIEARISLIEKNGERKEGEEECSLEN